MLYPASPTPTRRDLLRRGALLLFAPPLGLSVLASEAESVAPPAPAKAPDPALAPVKDEPGLPRVLLLGDSISMGYTLPVREMLKGVANVHRPAENCADTGHGLKRLGAWLGTEKWDVVHFNFGLHDLKYLDAQGKYVTPDKGGKQVNPLPVYEANLKQLVAKLAETKAHLIWASTTPVPDKSQGRVEHEELGYNAAAKKIMSDAKVPIDDLHAVALAHQAEIQRPHNVHFSDAGYRLLAESVTRSIRAILELPHAA